MHDSTSVPGADEEEERIFHELMDGFRSGEVEAREQLFRHVYSQLHQLARSRMRSQRPAHTLQPTALVHETFLKLFGTRPLNFSDQSHLLRAAARAMSQILADHARHKISIRAGGAWGCVELGSSHGSDQPEAVTFLDFDGEIERLARIEPDMARAMQMRYILDLEIEEIADILDYPLRTLERRLRAASAMVAARLR